MMNLLAIFNPKNDEINSVHLMTNDELLTAVQYKAVYDAIEGMWFWVDDKGRVWINALIDDESFDHLLVNVVDRIQLEWLFQSQSNGFIQV